TSSSSGRNWRRRSRSSGSRPRWPPACGLLQGTFSSSAAGWLLSLASWGSPPDAIPGAGDVLESPGPHHFEHGVEVAAFGGQMILRSWRVLAVEHALDDPVAFEAPYAVCQHVGRHALVGGQELAEAGLAGGQVAGEEQCPAVADHVQSAGDWAVGSELISPTTRGLAAAALDHSISLREATCAGLALGNSVLSLQSPAIVRRKPRSPWPGAVYVCGLARVRLAYVASVAARNARASGTTAAPSACGQWPAKPSSRPSRSGRTSGEVGTLLGNLHGARRRSDTGEDRRMAWIASLEASSGDSAITVAGRSKRWSASARGSARSVP